MWPRIAKLPASTLSLKSRQRPGTPQAGDLFCAPAAKSGRYRDDARCRDNGRSQAMQGGRQRGRQALSCPRVTGRTQAMRASISLGEPRSNAHDIEAPSRLVDSRPNPLPRQVGILRGRIRAHSSAWLERIPDKDEVAGSNPAGPTRLYVPAAVESYPASTPATRPDSAQTPRIALNPPRAAPHPPCRTRGRFKSSWAHADSPMASPSAACRANCARTPLPARGFVCLVGVCLLYTSDAADDFAVV